MDNYHPPGQGGHTPPTTGQSPAGQPPMGQQPVSPSPAGQPPVGAQPPVYQPPAGQPPMWQPPVGAQPPVYQSPAGQPPMWQPPMGAQPPVYQPPAVQPPMYQPPMGRPVDQPATWQPPMGPSPMYTYAPSAPQQQETTRLRKDANYLGALLISQTAAMQLLFTVVVLLMMAIGLLGSDRLSMDDLGLGNTAYLVLYAVIYSVSMALPAILVSVICRRRHFPLGPAKPLNSIDSFLALLAGMGGCMIANFFASFVMSFLMQFGVEMPESPEMLLPTIESLLMNLFVTAVLPAFLEELVFRGYVLRALRPYGDGFAVVVSAVIFGVVHGNAVQVPFALVVGLILGWLYVVTDNIWLPVALHFCNNAFATLMDYASLSMNEDTAGVFYAVCMFAVLGIGGIALLILFLRRSEMLKFKKEQPQLLSVGQRLKGLLSAPAFLVSVIILAVLMLIEVVV